MHGTPPLYCLKRRGSTSVGHCDKIIRKQIDRAQIFPELFLQSLITIPHHRKLTTETNGLHPVHKMVIKVYYSIISMRLVPLVFSFAHN